MTADRLGVLRWVFKGGGDSEGTRFATVLALVRRAVGGFAGEAVRECLWSGLRQHVSLHYPKSCQAGQYLWPGETPQS